MKTGLRTCIAASVGMLLLILDTKTALLGAKDGISLCLGTLVPALLPFVFLSAMLTSALTGASCAVLRPLGRLLRMPQGSESLFLIGALGGYPTGAQTVAAAWERGQLNSTDAARLLGFCCNAGPSFLFGITAAAFSGKLTPWLLWGIHLLSAVIAGLFLPGGSRGNVQLKPGKALPAKDALAGAVRTMAQICGWVILFRIILSFASRWFLWLFPVEVQVLLSGFAELSIGCTSLWQIENSGLRFVIASAMIGFGGFCVGMQTVSCAGDLGMGMYLPGKLLQCLISVLFSAVVQRMIFLPEQCAEFPVLFYIAAALLTAALALILQKAKKRYSIPHAVGV